MTLLYHHIFIGLPDLYRDAGPSVFKEIASTSPDRRNLLVIPSALEETIIETQGGNASLNHLAKLLKTKKLPSSEINRYLNEGENLTNQALVVRASEGMDIAYLTSSEDINIKKVFQTVKKKWRTHEKGGPFVVSSEPIMHLRYQALGLQTQYPGFLTPSAGITQEGLILGNVELHGRLQTTKRTLPLEEAAEILERKLFMNQFVYFRGERQEYAVVEAGIIRKNDRIIKIDQPHLRLLDPREYNQKIKTGQYFRDDLFGISPKDMEQYLALQYGILNPDISLFFICGGSGSGKTILSYVGAMDQVVNYSQEIEKLRNQGSSPPRHFRDMFIIKPIDIMGGKSRDLGFLPGDLLQKLLPHLSPYGDSHKLTTIEEELDFEYMFRHAKRPHRGLGSRGKLGKIKLNGGYAELPINPPIDFDHTGFIRGRSINSLIVIDEAQNLTLYEIKTIIERTSEGAKIIVIGDPNQVDRGTRERNGLTGAIAHFLDEPFSGLMHLTRNYRSEMAEKARAMNAFSDGS